MESKIVGEFKRELSKTDISEENVFRINLIFF